MQYVAKKADDFDKLMESVREKIHNSTRNEKLKLLTLAPIS